MDQARHQRSIEEWMAVIEVLPGDRIAIHLGEDPSPGFVEASKKAVEEAWGDDVGVLFVSGKVGMTVIRSIDAEV